MHRLITWLGIGVACAAVLLVALRMVLGKRQVTPQQFADELEKHFLGTDGAWGWDNTTSISIADARLDRLRKKLYKFDSLARKSRKEEFKEVIAALRRGEIPDVDDQ